MELLSQAPPVSDDSPTCLRNSLRPQAPVATPQQTLRRVWDVILAVLREGKGGGRALLLLLLPCGHGAGLALR